MQMIKSQIKSQIIQDEFDTLWCLCSSKMYTDDQVPNHVGMSLTCLLDKDNDMEKQAPDIHILHMMMLVEGRHI